MLVPGVATYDYIIQCESFTVAEQGVDQPLEGGSCSMEPKRHHSELEDSFKGCKSCFFLILRMEVYLPIAFGQVEGTHVMGFPQLAEQDSGSGNGVGIKGGSPVDLCEVYTKPHATVWLGDKDDWASPCAGGGFNDAQAQHFLDFPIHDFSVEMHGSGKIQPKWVRFLPPPLLAQRGRPKTSPPSMNPRGLES